MAFVAQGPISAKARGDDEGYRYYDTKWRVKSILSGDHGAQALDTAGLPAIGSTYSLGNDFDTDAYCLPGWTADREHDGPEKPNWYIVSIPFSTKPMRRCQDARPTDPLLEPLRKGGASKTITKELTHDAVTDAKIKSSTHELFHGKLLEVEATGGSQFWVEANVATLPISTLKDLEHKKNDAPMWGQGIGEIKFSSWTFENKYYGVCFEFFTLRMVFDIDRDGFIARIPDHGRLVWDGVGAKSSPDSYMVDKDLADENRPTGLLNMDGERWDNVTPPDPSHYAHKYPYGDLTALGVASAFT